MTILRPEPFQLSHEQTVGMQTGVRRRNALGFGGTRRRGIAFGLFVSIVLLLGGCTAEWRANHEESNGLTDHLGLSRPLRPVAPAEGSFGVDRRAREIERNLGVR